MREELRSERGRETRTSPRGKNFSHLADIRGATTCARTDAKVPPVCDRVFSRASPALIPNAREYARAR
jgi:hypothetical protein